MHISIEKIRNGYIITAPHGRTVFHDLENVFEELLGHFEGRYPTAGGQSYGVVTIQRDPPVIKEHADVF